MTNKQLFDSLNNADDKYIIEAVEDFPELGVEKKRGFIRVLKYVLPCAACAAVIFAFTSVIGNNAGIFTPFFAGETSAEVSDSVSDGNVESSGAEISAEAPDSTEDSTVIDIESQPGELTNTYSKFLEEEKKFSETFVSPGIVYGEPLPLPEKDPATFWEGDLPVLPLKNCEESALRDPVILQGFSSSYLEADRGEAVYAVFDGEVTFVGYPGGRICRGLTVILRHDEDKYTTYEYLDEDLGIPVKVGDKVTAGQVVGYAGLFLNCGVGGEKETHIGFAIYGCDPLEVYCSRTTYFEEWLNSGLVKPLDNAGDDFEFDSFREGLSRNEKITPAPYGAKVYAAADGVVGGCGYEENSGLLVSIKHADGFIETIYYHLDENMPHVDHGDVVKAGDVIGHISDNSCSGVSGLGYFVIDETFVKDMPSYRSSIAAAE